MARHSTSSCERESRPAAKTGASTTGQQARLCGARRRTAQRHWNRLAGSGVAASSAEATIDIARVTKRPKQLGWFHVAPPRRRALARDAVQSLGEFPRRGRSRTTVVAASNRWAGAGLMTATAAERPLRSNRGPAVQGRQPAYLGRWLSARKMLADRAPRIRFGTSRQARVESERGAVRRKMARLR